MEAVARRPRACSVSVSLWSNVVFFWCLCWILRLFGGDHPLREMDTEKEVSWFSVSPPTTPVLAQLPFNLSHSVVRLCSSLIRSDRPHFLYHQGRLNRPLRNRSLCRVPRNPNPSTPEDGECEILAGRGVARSVFCNNWEISKGV